jgi:hypothetical protein
MLLIVYRENNHLGYVFAIFAIILWQQILFFDIREELGPNLFTISMYT